MPRRPARSGAFLTLALLWWSGARAGADFYKVQLASYHRSEQAWVGWSELKRSHPDLLNDLTPSVERVDLGLQRGTFFRLQVGAFVHRAEAESLCSRCRSNGMDCIVVADTRENANRWEPSSSSPGVESPSPDGDPEARQDEGEQTRGRETAGAEGVRPDSVDDGVSETSDGAEDSSEESEEWSGVNPQTPAPGPEAEIRSVGNSPTEPAGYVRILGGVTFAPTTDGLAGGGAGFNVTPSLQIVLELGRFGDVLSRELNPGPYAERGLERRPRASAFYGMGGLRFLVPTSKYGRPYATLSAGIARLQDDTILTFDGVDITDEFRVVGAFPLEAPTTYESLVSLGGGVNWETKRGLSFDVGYRFVRIFTVEPIDVGAAYFAVGYVFRRPIDP
jgi:hypothetical protein